MVLTRQESFRLSTFFYLIHAILLVPLMCVFAGQDGFFRSCGQSLWVFLTLLTYPWFYVLPGYLVSLLLLLPHKRCLVIANGIWSCIYVTVLTLLLFIDVMLLERMGFHINGLVINLLITPGGFEAIGLDGATLVPAVVGVLCFTALVVGIFYLVWGKTKLRGRLVTCAWLWGARAAYVHLALGVLLFCSMIITACADMWRTKDIMIGMNNYPVCMKMRMRSFFKRLGVKRVAREEQVFKRTLTKVGELNYPDKPVARDGSHRRMNVIWIVCESLRHDMLTAERMPNLWSYAQKNQRFTRHYSGGHGTRPAMFSMFYGLYGNNWDSFLNSHRGPLLIDWMLEDDYAILCQTSAHFTYPEFDQTVFAAVRKEDLVEQNTKLVPWQRDITLTDRMLAFIKKQHAQGKPFFSFGFYEETHAPYTFDEKAALTQDYLHQVNFALVNSSHATQLRNRMVNAAHGLDRQVGRILSLLESEPGLRENTLFVFTGDHGEEFFEKGHLGHNSTFVEEQIHVPLVLGLPGLPAACHDMMTNHVDLVATLAPYFGVMNPPEDYTVGMNIMAPGFKREHAIICGWNVETLMTPDFKYIIPQGNGMAFIGRNYFTGNDVVTDLPDDFMSRHASLLFKVQTEMTRFVRNPD